MADPTILLTGFPGFLGSALVERLLDRGHGPVACLVQPTYREAATRRATALAGDESDRIRIYEGDITEPGLGLDGTGELASVTELYHLAAVYDLGVSAAVGDAVNVRGTEHVLDVAAALGVDRFQYVSTCYVSGRYDGVFTSEMLAEGQSFNNHYERTKHEAELLVRDRMAEGLPATIYRPSIAVGDSETGETDKYDGPYYLVRLLLAQPSTLSAVTVPPGASRTELNVVPRDFVVDAIAHLSGREDTVGEVYQLCDPTPRPVPAFVEAVADALGHRVVTPTVPKPVIRNAFAALGCKGMPAEPATIDYFDQPTRYVCPNTRRALEGTGIECPPFASYVDRLVAFVRANPDVGDDAMA
jgi:thioester reductase-like protein